jgi:PEGA domain-containing protein
VPAPPSWFTKTGTLVVESKPQGVPLMVDGQPQGVTPVTLQLESGRHEVELHGIGKPRVFNVYVSRGAHISQYIEMSSRGRATQPSQEPSY